jgi:hypothetical protein
MSFLSKSLSVIAILPLMLNRFSIMEVNLWYLYASMINILVLIDAGFGSAFTRMFAYGTVGLKSFDSLRSSTDGEKSSGDFDPVFIATAYHYMRKVYRSIFLIAFLSLATMGSWLLSRYYPSGYEQTQVILTWILFVLSFPLTLWGNLFVNLLQGTHNVPLVRRWDTLFNVVSTFSSLIILLVYPNVYVLIAVSQFWGALSTYRNYRLVRHKYPFLSSLRGDDSLRIKIRKNVVPSAVKSGIGVFMSQGIVQASGFVYAGLASPDELASYLIGLNLFQTIRNFSQAPFYSRLPELAACTGRGDIDSLRVIASKNMNRVYLIYSMAFFGLAYLHEPLFKLIKSHVAFPSPLLWSMLGLAFLIERFGAMHLQVYSTTNHIIWHYLNGITGTLMIALTFPLFPHFGIVAFPLAMLLAYLMCYSWYAPYMSYRFLNTSFWSYEKQTFIPILLLIIINTLVQASI